MVVVARLFPCQNLGFLPFPPLLDLKRVESMVRTRLSKLQFLCFWIENHAFRSKKQRRSSTISDYNLKY